MKNFVVILAICLNIYGSYAEEQECKYLDQDIKSGEEISLAGDGICGLVSCTNGTIQSKICPSFQFAVPPGAICHEVNDLTQPFPECCQKMVCTYRPCRYEGRNMTVGEEYFDNEPCQRVTCEEKGRVTISPCATPIYSPPKAGMTCKEIFDHEKPHPGCCPQLICEPTKL